jgi:hypothetical protein
VKRHRRVGAATSKAALEECPGTFPPAQFKFKRPPKQIFLSQQGERRNRIAKVKPALDAPAMPIARRQIDS